MSVTVSDVAAALEVTAARVGQYIRDGRIPAQKIGKSWSIPDDWVLLEAPPSVPRVPPPVTPSPTTQPPPALGDDWDTWVRAQKSAMEARTLAQAADLYWRARSRERTERLALGQLVPINDVQTMIDSIFAAIDAVMGPALATSWAGRRVSEADILALMDTLRHDIRARWIAHGIDIS